MKNVVVAIATCNRPAGLIRCLRSVLNGTRLPDAIVIVDNHASGSGIEALSNFQSKLHIPIVSAIEQNPGISHARNKCVELSRSLGAEYIAFIDDDEEASDSWLNEITQTQESGDFDVVSGTVVPIYEDIPNPIFVKTGYYRQEMPTRDGQVVADSTANVLIRISALSKVSGPFDPSYALTGGSDKKLFLQLHRLGIRMGWSPKAIVFEHVDAARLSESWIIKRIQRNASINYRVESDLFGKARLTELVVGSGLVAAGLLTRPIGWVVNRASFLSKSLIAKGMGRLAALDGKGLSEYASYHKPDV